MDREKDKLSDELKAILAASRELSPEDDDALVDHFLEQLQSRQVFDSARSPTCGASGMKRDARVPIAIVVGTGTFLSIVGALMSGASIGEFLLLWIFTTLVMAAVVQIGLIIDKSHRAVDRLIK